MNADHRARPHLVSALRLIRDGHHLAAQHAIQAAGLACSPGMRPPDLEAKGVTLRIMEIHSRAVWERRGDGEPGSRLRANVNVQPAIDAIRAALAGNAVQPA